MRTSVAAVKAILGNSPVRYNYDGDTDLEPFITTASVIVDRVEECAEEKGKDLTATELELIERWLSAHVYTIMDRAYSSRSTASASGSFQGQTAMYFESSFYGQMACNLDYSNCLRNMGAQQEAGVAWLGKTPSEQIPVWDRE